MKNGFVADLFSGPGNQFWDLGRIVGFIGVLIMIVGAGWNMHLGMPIELGPSGLGGGLTGVIGAAAALIAAKDFAHTKAISQAKQDDTAAISQEKQDETAAAAPPPEAQQVIVVNPPVEDKP